MAAPTFEQKMLKALEDALVSNVAVASISVDGTTTSFTSRAQLLAEYSLWKNKVAKQAGGRSMIRSINMGSTMPTSS